MKIALVSEIYTSFDDLLIIAQTFNLIFGLVVFIAIIQFLRILNFNRYMWMVGSTLRNMKMTMGTFAFIFLGSFCGFVQLAHHLFCSESSYFKDIWASFLYMATIMCGRFKHAEVDSTHLLLSPLYFVTFNLVMIWVMTSLFISLMTQAITKARDEVKGRSNDADLLEYLLEKFGRMIPFLSPMSSMSMYGDDRLLS